jgi:hypothetical protein
MLAALAVVATGVASTPSWASPPVFHRHVHPTTTSTSTSTATTATTVPASASTTVPTTPLPEPPPAVAEDTCVKGIWAPQFQGRPTTYLVGSDGAYLWHDTDGGWALRVTHANARERVVFSGSLYSATGQFVDVTSLAPGGDDIIYETGDKHTVLFRFVDDGLVDGLSFGTMCAKAFTVNIHLGARLAAPGQVYLGAGGDHPLSNPFRVTRVRGASNSVAKLVSTTRPTTTTTAPPA